jgi:GAF domain
MKTFVKVIEVWIPDRERTRLELGCGLYGPYKAFREVSELKRFHYNDGLPGRAWASARPVVLTQFDDSYFRRIDAARQIGLTAGIAIPVFAGSFLLAVVVFLCGDDEEHAGAIEVWGQNPDNPAEMTLIDGYFGTLEKFEWISRHVNMARGQGLPGGVWEKRMPMIIDDLGHADTFLRWRNAGEAGMTTGLGIPCARTANEEYAVTFLSARDTPIARRFEIWVPAGGGGLGFEAGHCDQDPNLELGYCSSSIAKGEGTIGRVWLTGVPAVCEDLANDKSVAGHSARLAGLHSMLAMPVIENAALKAVVAMYL